MKDISIVGAGTMGHGLAIVFALGGYSVVLHDVSAGALANARKLIRAALNTLTDSGLAETPASTSTLEGRIQCTTNLAIAAERADLIMEAVTENADIKQRLFSELDRLTPLDTLWASNTSFLDIIDLLPERRQSKSLIAHWYAPPYIIDLVDLVPSPGTAPETVAVMKEVLHGIGKKPVVLPKFISGFIVNRLQAALNLEVYFLLDQGYATAEQIDIAVKCGLGLRMPLLGHLKKADYTGLELVQRTLAKKTYQPPEVTGRSQTLDHCVQTGRTGVMAGKGFYDYQGRSPEELFRARDLKLLALKKFLLELGDLE